MNGNRYNEPSGYAANRSSIKMKADPRLFRRKYSRPGDKKLTIGFYESASVLFLAFVIAGSLYPFEFDFSLTADRIEGFSVLPGRADLLANLALFVPLGFAAGMLQTRMRQFIVLSSSIFVAVACQAIQIYLSSRTPAIWDIVLNTGGLLLGLFVTRFVHHPSHRSETKMSLASFIVIAAFLGYQLAPFAPSLDLGLLRASFVRLLDPSTISFASLLTGAAYVFLVAGALKTDLASNNANRILVGLVIAVLILKPITATAHVSLAGLLGMLLALYPACRITPNRGIFWLLGVLALSLYIYDGLTPFIVRSELVLPELSPLAGIVDGNWLANITALLWKSFLFTAAISVLFGAFGNSTRTPTLAVVTVAFFVEGAQVVLNSGSPSILDVLLATLLGAAFFRSVRASSHHVDGYGRNHRLKSSLKAGIKLKSDRPTSAQTR